jgi:serine/threonine protein kinase
MSLIASRFYGVNSADEEWRLGLKKLWKSNNYFPRCSIESLFETNTIKILTEEEKESLSDSLIVFGVLKEPNEFQNNPVLSDRWKKIKRDVVLKISFPSIQNFSPLHGQASKEDFEQFVSQTVSKNEFLSAVDQMDAEIKMYQIATDLISDFVSPCLIACYGAWQCTYDEIKLNSDSSPVMQKFLAGCEEIYKSSQFRYPVRSLRLQPNDPLKFLLLEKSNGRAFSDFLLGRNNLVIEEDALISILFQIIYTIHVCAERGIRHGDLHDGNIFIDEVENKSAVFNFYLYTPNSQLEFAAVPTNGFIAKIFDWDFGSVSMTPHAQRSSLHWPKPFRNRVSDFLCDKTSACNYNAKADVAKILGNVYQTFQREDYPFRQKYKRVQEFLERHVNAAILKQRNICKGSLNIDLDCKVVETDKSCVTAWEIPDCLMHTTYEILHDSVLFKNLWHNHKTYSPKAPFIFGNWPNEIERKKIFEFASKNWDVYHQEKLKMIGLLK